MIEEFTANVSFERFREEPMRVAAVERYLLMISEAAIRLGPHAETLCPGLPWHNIRSIGNWIRHQYDRVDLDIVWHTPKGLRHGFGMRGVTKQVPST